MSRNKFHSRRFSTCKVYNYSQTLPDDSGCVIRNEMKRREIAFNHRPRVICQNSIEVRDIVHIRISDTPAKKPRQPFTLSLLRKRRRVSKGVASRSKREAAFKFLSRLAFLRHSSVGRSMQARKISPLVYFSRGRQGPHPSPSNQKDCAQKTESKKKHKKRGGQNRGERSENTRGEGIQGGREEKRGS